MKDTIPEGYILHRIRHPSDDSKVLYYCLPEEAARRGDAYEIANGWLEPAYEYTWSEKYRSELKRERTE